MTEFTKNCHSLVAVSQSLVKSRGVIKTVGHNQPRPRTLTFRVTWLRISGNCATMFLYSNTKIRFGFSHSPELGISLPDRSALPTSHIALVGGKRAVFRRLVTSFQPGMRLEFRTNDNVSGSEIFFLYTRRCDNFEAAECSRIFAMDNLIVVSEN